MMFRRFEEEVAAIVGGAGSISRSRIEAEARDLVVFGLRWLAVRRGVRVARAIGGVEG